MLEDRSQVRARAKDLGFIIDSIITLSKEPVKELSFIMVNIDDYLRYLEDSSFIAKPFIKKDLSAIMNMDVKELYESLDRIKNNLEKIDIAASSIKDKYKYRKYLFNERPLTEKMTLKEEKEENIKEETEKKEEKEVKKETPIKYFYCPECGHKCKGEHGLKIHVRKKHNEEKEEILKTMKLYVK